MVVPSISWPASSASIASLSELPAVPKTSCGGRWSVKLNASKR
jgi:hypothetical protein